MHCIDPACVGACMLGALAKGEWGAVSWDPAKCVGCRYCEVACPFNVPKYEWSKLAPKIVKCELCRDRLAKGQEPGCSEVCPRQAVIYGKYHDLLDEAHRRLAAHPDKYVQKVYGEHELGGTQVLYLSHVPFEKLGLPEFGNDSIAAGVRDMQERVYQGGLTPLFVYGGLIAATRHFWSDHQKEAKHEAAEHGLEEQL
jgi:ferredoxin